MSKKYFEGIPTAEEDDVEIRVRQKIQWVSPKSIRITVNGQTEFIPRGVISGKSNYKKGDWNIICDVCGCKMKRSEARKRWDGMLVCGDDWEAGEQSREGGGLGGASPDLRTGHGTRKAAPAGSFGYGD